MSPDAHQKMKVTIEFEYDAPVYDGDPDDVFELARQEEVDLYNGLGEALDYFVQEYNEESITVRPKL